MLRADLQTGVALYGGIIIHGHAINAQRPAPKGTTDEKACFCHERHDQHTSGFFGQGDGAGVLAVHLAQGGVDPGVDLGRVGIADAVATCGGNASTGKRTKRETAPCHTGRKRAAHRGCLFVWAGPCGPFTLLKPASCLALRQCIRGKLPPVIYLPREISGFLPAI